MWITTYHRFTNRVAFLAASQIAGWTCPPGQEPEPPQGVAVEIVGPIVAPARIGDGGALIPGDVLDPRHHVHVARHARQLMTATRARRITDTWAARCGRQSGPPASEAARVGMWLIRPDKAQRFSMFQNTGTVVGTTPVRLVR
jgi:hypothetical protein